FTVQPSSTTAGTIITPAVRVTVQDAFGNRVTSFPSGRPTITVAIGNNPGGDTLSGTKARLTGTGGNAGIATFNDLSIAKAGEGYTLTAAATGLTGGASANFTITPRAAKLLVFTVQPSGAPAGAVITPAVLVTARDSLGNTATSFTGAVTVAIGNNPGGGALSGTSNPSAVGGVATFADLSIDKVGTGYTLTAAATGLTGANSNGFTISAGAASKLALTTQPSSSAQSGVALAQQPVLQLQDANNNPVSQNGVTVTATVSPAGANASNATATTGASGAATFSGLTLKGAPGSYTLSFAATGLTSVTSGTITLSAASTTTAITGHTPDPSVVGQAVTVTYTVTSAGGTPTGTVTVSDGTDTCSGTVAAGTCTLTPASAGTKTLVATYEGNPSFATSTSAGASHTVN